MGQPASSKSSLAGRTPVTPPPADPVPQAPAAPAAEERRAAVAPEKKSKYPPKVSLYQDLADTARVRGAILHTQVAEGTRSLSNFINNAVIAEVKRLEAKYNDGQAFPRAAPWDADAHTDSGRQDDRYPALRRGSDRIGSVAAHRLPVRHHMTGAPLGLWL